jgi:hypothetical protein
MKRKISTILCLDVVGYSTRMAEDAETTLNAMQRILRDVIRPLVNESPRVCWRDLCSNVTQLFDLRSSFHRMPPLLLGAGHSRWHCAVVLSCTS